MKLNNKGFSMVELFAVIFIASAVIFPMMTTLVNNLEINDRMQTRRSALSIAQGALDGFNRMEFSKIETMMDGVETSTPYYVEIDASDFDEAYPALSTEDQALAKILFELEANNQTFPADRFKVFIIHFNIDGTVKNYLTGNNSNLPQSVKDEVLKIETSILPNPELYYIYVWIEYDVDTESSLVLGGLLSND